MWLQILLNNTELCTTENYVLREHWIIFEYVSVEKQGLKRSIKYYSDHISSHAFCA